MSKRIHEESDGVKIEEVIENEELKKEYLIK